MSKYTILYKNGKTWNGKCNLLRDIRTHKLEPRCGYDIPVWVSIDNKSLSDGDIIRFVLDVEDNGDNYTRYSTYRILGGGRFMMLVDTVDTPIKPTRKPNPASVTKKQKAFDKAYAEWIEMQADLNQGRRGGLDISIKAYKKWLWEQKQVSPDGWITWHGGECPVPYDAKVEVKFRCGETNDRLVAGRWRWGKGDGSHSIVAYRLLGEGGKPVKYSEPKKAPIKVTYTFWLGAFGEID